MVKKWSIEHQIKLVQNEVTLVKGNRENILRNKVAPIVKAMNNTIIKLTDNIF